MQTFLRKVFVVLFFLGAMGVVDALANPNRTETDTAVLSTDVHWTGVVSQLITYGTFLVLFSKRIRSSYKLLASSLPLLALLALCCFSATWSGDPSLTIRRSAMLVATTLTALMVGKEFDLKSLVRLVNWAFLIHIALVLVLLAVAPSFVLDHTHLGEFKGLSGHKNLFGIQMGIAALCFLYSSPLPRYRWARMPLCGIALVLMVASGSAGSIIATVCGFSLLPLWRLFRLNAKIRYPTLITAFFVMAFVTMEAVEHIEYFLALFSKNSTFSGRTQLWILVLAAISQHPFIGVGFDSFWEGLKGGSLNVIAGAGWFVPHAHNGYLDLLLSLGLLGAVVFAIVLVQGTNIALKTLIEDRSELCYVPIGFIPMWLSYNLVESCLLSRTQLPYVFFVCITASLVLRRHTRLSAQAGTFGAHTLSVERRAAA
jgi:O-antigen ligase